MTLYLATHQGLVTAQREKNGWRPISQSLTGQALTSLALDSRALYAGSVEGVYRSLDRGQTWQDCSAGLTIRHVRWLACHGGRTFAGVEPAAIFVLRPSEQAWRECPEVADLRDRHQWFLPYSPEAGCIRGFAFHGAQAYAAAEVGGALCSDNGGDSWRLCAGSSGSPSLSVRSGTGIHPDVHSVEVPPSSADLVYAPTGGGFYRSPDGGRTWQRRHPAYVRAAWVDPTDPEHIVTGPADGPGRNGRIETTHDGGQTWQPAAQGLAVPWPGRMVERFLQVENELLAVLSDGALVASPLPGLHWQPILQNLSGVSAAAAAG